MLRHSLSAWPSYGASSIRVHLLMQLLAIPQKTTKEERNTTTNRGKRDCNLL